MSKKPFYNAIIAAGYITLVVSGVNWTGHMSHVLKDNIFMPMGMLALLVFSVALMGFLFFYQPALLLLENKRVEAVRLFLTTIGIFAGITLCFLGLALLIGLL